MFTVNLEDGREAPSKARKKGAKRLEFLVLEITILSSSTMLIFLYKIVTLRFLVKNVSYIFVTFLIFFYSLKSVLF